MFKLKHLYATLLLGAFISAPVMAEEEESDFHYQVEATIGVGAIDSTFVNSGTGGGYLGLRFRAEWKGLFIEGNEFGMPISNGWGYNFYESKHWELDAFVGTSHGPIRPEDSGLHEGLVGIKNRDADARFGLRATGSYDNHFFRFYVAPKSFTLENGSGLYASAWHSYTWQWGNWNMHTTNGIEYHSKEILDYYYGVRADEASDLFPEYTADDGFGVIASVGARYPINEDWVFDTKMSVGITSSTVADSPLTEQNHWSAVSFGVSYVF